MSHDIAALHDEAARAEVARAQENLIGAERVLAASQANALKELGIIIDKRWVELEEPIKALGIYTVDIRLLSGVTGKVKV